MACTLISNKDLSNVCFWHEANLPTGPLVRYEREADFCLCVKRDG
nr:MAG TPA_asm: hypothetical protein [Caudoviricetes sp.]